jgi:LytS/YehU family sensor histidine kinase
LAETRLEALRAQMNPHFIFNCLNSINRYIIKSDIKTSSLYLTRFAKLIRLILDNSEHKKVVLSNELEALKLYIDMESLRFDHKFSFDVSIDPEVDADNIEIPPLIIQPYVENAIWHGLLHKDSGGHLSVHVSRDNGSLVCEIADNGIGREKAMEYKSKNAPTRKSVGMKLTEERLQIASDDFSVAGSQKIIDLFDENGEASGTKVILTLPI